MAEPKKNDGLRPVEPKRGDRRVTQYKPDKEQTDDHRERFNSLLRAAVRKPEPKD